MRITTKWVKGEEYVESLPNKLSEAIRDGIKECLIKAVATSKADYFDKDQWETDGDFDYGQGPGVNRFARDANPPPGPLISRSGDLMNSIGYRVNKKGFTGYMGSSLPYARMHEFGGQNSEGAFVPARPFLRPAMDDNLDAFNNIIIENVIRGLK